MVGSLLLPGLLSTTSATAVDVGRYDQALTASVAPAVTQANGQFYTESQMPAAWDAAIETSEAEFTDTVTLPDEPPLPEENNSSQGLVVVDVNSEQWFEVGYAELLLAREWRCGWLETASQARVSGDDVLLSEAEAQLAGFFDTDLGFTANEVEYAQLQAALITEAEARGVPLETVRLEVECGIEEN